MLTLIFRVRTVGWSSTAYLRGDMAMRGKMERGSGLKWNYENGNIEKIG